MIFIIFLSTYSLSLFYFFFISLIFLSHFSIPNIFFLWYEPQLQIASSINYPEIDTVEFQRLCSKYKSRTIPNQSKTLCLSIPFCHNNMHFDHQYIRKSTRKNYKKLLMNQSLQNYIHNNWLIFSAPYLIIMNQSSQNQLVIVFENFINLMHYLYDKNL